ncbi:hypothetical protein [Curtobacterium sp. MCBD17_021]|uniref:hypothetical protein n=1 Tax=Curtobacterium sp. MCBD17_021 TaxID=2175665 RepID=UPI0011B71A30|nr:hypothetical protein [Curtobacterium sp. MCBD17_021]
MLPPTADARFLAELTSHASDLSEAASTVEAALEAGEESPGWLPLTMHAATAYVRPFIHSNVRRRLDQIPEFPGVLDEWSRLHRMVRQYRNTTVAHSQSGLATPVVMALLNEDAAVGRVMAVTVSHPMPRAIAEQLQQLIAAISALVDSILEPVAVRLEQQLATVDAATVAAWPALDVNHELDEAFSGVHRRTQQPQVRLYWHVERTQR